MRFLIATGVLTLLLAGAGAVASAAPTAALSSAEAMSPDIATWTSTLIRERAHSARAPRNHDIRRFASRVLIRTSRIAKALTRDAFRFLGTPYVFGGTSASGFDCSGFVQHVFAMLDIHLPRTADAQYYAERRAKGGLRVGDLVFFQTYEPGPSHVGIYIGGGKFVHASSSHGVMVSHLSDSYWASRYLGAKRVVASL